MDNGGYEEEGRSDPRFWEEFEGECKGEPNQETLYMCSKFSKNKQCIK